MSRMHKYVRDWDQVATDFVFALPVILIIVVLMEYCGGK